MGAQSRGAGLTSEHTRRRRSSRKTDDNVGHEQQARADFQQSCDDAFLVWVTGRQKRMEDLPPQARMNTERDRQRQGHVNREKDEGSSHTYPFPVEKVHGDHIQHSGCNSDRKHVADAHVDPDRELQREPGYSRDEITHRH
jgi:hypothetical protein